MALQQSKNTQKMLTNKNIWLSMFLLSLPILINNLIKSLNGMVDIYFIARMPESNETIESAIAALSLHEAFNNVLLALGVGLSIAAIAVISQYLGAGRLDKAKLNAGQFAFLSVVVGAFLNVVILSISWFALDWLGAKGQTYTYGLEYFNIRAYEQIAVVFFMVYQAIRQSQGSTIFPVVLNILGIVLNTILTWYFVEVLQMGPYGAGLATLIGNFAFVPLMIWDLIFRKKYITLGIKDVIPQKQSIIEIVPFAYPAAISQAITFFGFLLIQSFVLSTFGEEISTAFATGNKLSQLLMNPIYAITTIAAVYIGTNVGHNQPERAMRAYNESKILCFVLTCIAIGIAIPFRVPFVTLLIGESNPELIETSAEYTFWLLITQPFMALFQNYMAIFNGSGQSKLGLQAQSVRLWVFRIPMIIFLWLVFPAMGHSVIWTAMNISNVLSLFHAHYLKSHIKLDVTVKLTDDTGGLAV
jgi:putative MATE family efflux protein